MQGTPPLERNKVQSRSKESNLDGAIERGMSDRGLSKDMWTGRAGNSVQYGPELPSDNHVGSGQQHRLRGSKLASSASPAKRLTDDFPWYSLITLRRRLMDPGKYVLECSLGFLQFA